MKQIATLAILAAFFVFVSQNSLLAQARGGSRLTSNGQYSGQYSGKYSGSYSGQSSGQSTSQYAGGNPATQAAIARTLPLPDNSGACGELFPTAPGTDYLYQDSQGRRC